MRSVFVILLVALLWLHGVTGFANFSASVAARFMLPCTGSSQYNNPPGTVPTSEQCQLYPPSSGTNPLTQAVSIAWGLGVVAGYRSNLTFVPYQNVIISTDSSRPVPIGELKHQNYPIDCHSSCAQYIPTFFKLDLFINVRPVGSTQTFSFEGIYNMNLDETQNQDARSDPSANPPQPCTISGIATEPSWVANGGYTTSQPCCPYYTTNLSPGTPPFSEINGPCSDRVTFTNAQAPINFTLPSGTSYTLRIVGFSKTLGSLTPTSFFTSQENQLQSAYVFAYMVTQCSSAGICNDNKNCTKDQCVNGTCVNTPVAINTPCNDPGGQEIPYNPTSQCAKWKCNVKGTCKGSAINTNGFCSNPGTFPSTKTRDCAASSCNGGVCGWNNLANGLSCNQTTASVTPTCQAKKCSNGKCTVQSQNEGASCTPSGIAGSYVVGTKAQCNTATCLNGGCNFVPKSTGSCTGLTATLCNLRRCQTSTRSGLVIGTCTFLYNSLDTGSCTGIGSVRQCQKRACFSKSATPPGTCGYTANTAQGSCTANGGTPVNVKECWKRICKGTTGTGAVAGSCGYSAGPTNGGSCGIGTLTARVCNKRLCTGTTCGYQYNGQDTGSCTGVGTARDCQKRTCFNKGGSPAPGSCGFNSNLGQGSCTVGGALLAKECNKRTCKSTLVSGVSGSCGYAADDGGSCTVNSTLTARICNKRICSNGACGYQFNSQDLGSCTGVGAARDCQKRTCFSKAGSIPGTCNYNYNSGQGSCTAIGTGKDCNRRICQNKAGAGGIFGSCGYRFQNTNGGSCTGDGSMTAQVCNTRGCSSSANGAGTCKYSVASGSCTSVGVPKECNKRTCKTKSATPPGSCGYSSQTGGSCVGTIPGSQLNQCTRRLCGTVSGSGACQLNMKSGTCA